jgi:hypothetical protein
VENDIERCPSAPELATCSAAVQDLAQRQHEADGGRVESTVPNLGGSVGLIAADLRSVVAELAAHVAGKGRDELMFTASNGRPLRNTTRLLTGWMRRSRHGVRTICGLALSAAAWWISGSGEAQVSDLGLWAEPPRGIEPRTYALRVRRSDRLS